MNEIEVVQLFTIIASLYPRDKAFSSSPPQMVSMWAEAMKDIPYEIAEKACVMHVRTSVFPPSIAEIVSFANDLMNGKSKATETAEMAWARVQYALADSAYHAEARFHELPPRVQELVGSPQQLKDWGQAETGSATLEFARERFLKQYDLAMRREKDIMLLPREVREFLQVEGDPIAQLVDRNAVDPKDPIPAPKPERRSLAEQQRHEMAQKFFDMATQIKAANIREKGEAK